jgi:pimeloyl-ACP methyl ester carboxylesterase
MMNDEYLSFCRQGSYPADHLYKIDDRVALHVLSFFSVNRTIDIPVILVGGLATMPESLREVIDELTNDFTVHYIETREKTGSVISGKVLFDIESMGLDTVKIIRELGFEEGKYVLMGYSLGATIIADCYRHLESKPRCMILMEPTPVFHYPAWSLPLIRFFGLPLYKILIPLSKWYLRTFRINTTEDAEMAVISFRALDHADPRKLRNVILSVAGYKVWDKLPLIDCPVLIAGTSKDHLHVKEEIQRMVEMIRNCRYIDLETNRRSHSAEMGQVVRDYVQSLG